MSPAASFILGILTGGVLATWVWAMLATRHKERAEELASTMRVIRGLSAVQSAQPGGDWKEKALVRIRSLAQAALLADLRRAPAKTTDVMEEITR